MKTVIEMARSVGAAAYTNRHYPDRPTHTFNVDQLQAFAELVRADERNRTWTQEHWTEYERSIAELEAQRTWVGLTDSEIEDCYQQGGIGRAAQILKEKNT